MKRFLATFLATVMVMSLVIPGLSLMVAAAGGALTATWTDTAPDFSQAITEEAWGTPVATISKDTANAVLHNYNGTAEDVSADVYFRWDSEYLYIGMVSADADIKGSNDSWIGDGFQIRFVAGTEMNYDTFHDVYVTLNADNSTAGGSDTAIEKGALIVDGKLHIMAKASLAAIGVNPANGENISFNMLRISGTSEKDYAGWLAWGPFYGVDSGNNPGVTEANLLALGGAPVVEEPEVPEIPEGALVAPKLDAAPDFSQAITEEAWGAPVATIDKNTANAVLHDYNGTAEDVSADVYFRWDGEYLYIGMVSADADLGGSNDSWVGDGFQIRFVAGSEMAYEGFTDVYVTLNGDRATAGGSSSAVEKNIVIADGKLNVMAKLALADITGLEAKAGALLSFNMLRISGTSAQPYEGWLAWGPFYGVGDKNNPGVTDANLLALGGAPVVEEPEEPEVVIPEGALVAPKLDAAPDFSQAITEEAWGAPVATIDKNTANAVLHDYNGTAEDVSADVYFRWDGEYLYIGMVSADSDLGGHNDSWVGDGFQIRFVAGSEMAYEGFTDVYVTLNGDRATAGGSSSAVEKNIVIADGKLNVMAKLALADITGLEAKAGALLSFNMLRISGTSAQPYEGWLSWGPFYGVDSGNNPGVTEANLLALGGAPVVEEPEDPELPAGMIATGKTDAAPDFSQVITEEAWGKPVATINKNTANAVLKDYNGTAEDVSADVYFRWDGEYLYIGMVSADSDLGGHNDSWVGDGFQIRFVAGSEMAYEGFTDVYVTLNGDRATAGGSSSAVEKNIVIADGKLNVMAKVALADIGVDAAAGETISFNMLRISGTSAQPYEGWLAWGPFYGVDSGNNPGVTDANCMMLLNKVPEAEGPVLPENAIPAGKLDAAPDFSKPINGCTWGEPVIKIDKNTANAVLHNYNGTAEDVSADVYFRWDGEYLYIGMVSADANLGGHNDSWVGDGFQIRFVAGSEMAYEGFTDVYVTLNGDCATAGGSSSAVEKNILYVDGKLHVMAKVKLADMGVTATEGSLISFNMIRISGTGAQPYEGWLAWGPFYGVGSDNNPGVTDANLLGLGGKVEVKGHTEVVDAAVEPDCDDTGLTEGKHCSVCGTVIVAQNIVDAKGHTEVVDAAVEATCTDTGLTEGKHCSVCNEVITPQTEVGVLGHDFETEWTVDVEPTTEAPGQKSRHCTRCEEKTDIIEIAKLVEIVDSSKLFTDLVVKDWSKAGIDFAVSYGYMNGIGNDKFDQEGTMTRAMIVSVLYRIAGQPETDAENPFTDLQADQTWYHDAVIWAADKGIVTGTSATTFAPTASVTREQMATFLYRFAKEMGYETEDKADLSKYPDADKVGTWATDALAWANAAGLINGAVGTDGVTRLDPQGEATREQVATILMRYCEAFAE